MKMMELFNRVEEEISGKFRPNEKVTFANIYIIYSEYFNDLTICINYKNASGKDKCRSILVENVSK